MKQLCRIACLFLCFFMILSVDGLAACADIDVSTASDGFFSVFYPGDASLKMKVGVTVAGQTTYYDYTVDECNGCSHSVTSHLAQSSECLLGSLLVACTLTLGDIENVLWSECHIC